MEIIGKIQSISKNIRLSLLNFAEACAKDSERKRESPFQGDSVEISITGWLSQNYSLYHQYFQTQREGEMEISDGEGE